MKVETTKMSSRGQVVIPFDIRKEIKAEEGTIFLVIASGEDLILKKIKMPSKKELIKDLKKMSEEGRKNAEKLGIKESDVPDLVDKSRKSKRR